MGQHVFIRLRDNRVIAPSTREQRIVARVVLDQGQAFGLMAFSVADTHIHLELACQESEAREMARRVEISLQRLLNLDVGFRPVEGPAAPL